MGDHVVEASDILGEAHCFWAIRCVGQPHPGSGVEWEDEFSEDGPVGFTHLVLGIVPVDQMRYAGCRVVGVLKDGGLD